MSWCSSFASHCSTWRLCGMLGAQGGQDIHVILTDNKLYGNSTNTMAHPENLEVVISLCVHFKSGDVDHDSSDEKVPTLISYKVYITSYCRGDYDIFQQINQFPSCSYTKDRRVILKYSLRS